MADIEKFATVSSKGQFTLPKEFRRVLGIKSGTRLRCFVRRGELRVRIAEESTEEEDPVLSQFLDLVGDDISKNPTLFNMPKDIEDRMRAVAMEDIDLDEEIEGVIAL